jgi:hypothetical protein
VIIVIASCYDQGARTVAARWGTDRAAVLTCADLSVPGWRHYSATPGTSVAVVSGRAVPVEDITGVVTCLPSVSELELLHIVPAERAYVAAEMTAFLLSWLSALTCPVVNRPSAVCLCGPFWRPEQWAHAASRAGMRVQPVSRRVALTAEATPAAAESITVTVVGERCFGQADPTVMDGVRRLARAASVDMLAVQVSGPEPGATFLAANLCPDLTIAETADAVLEHLEGRGTGVPGGEDQRRVRMVSR